MKANKYDYLIIVQGLYYGHWEDEATEESHMEARLRLKEYRDNMPQYAHRIIHRRELATV